jgi:hypothetical protein
MFSGLCIHIHSMSFNGLIQFSMTEKRIALIKQFERSWGGYFSFTLALIDDR